MKTHPLVDNVHGHMYAFEIENVYIGIDIVVRLLNQVDGVSDARAHKMFSKSYDIRVEFKYQNSACVVTEPFGDNSRYWIGPRNSEETKIDVHKIEEAFKQYRPPFIRELLGDILSLRMFSRVSSKVDNG